MSNKRSESRFRDKTVIFAELPPFILPHEVNMYISEQCSVPKQKCINRRVNAETESETYSKYNKIYIYPFCKTW